MPRDAKIKTLIAIEANAGGTFDHNN